MDSAKYGLLQSHVSGVCRAAWDCDGGVSFSDREIRRHGRPVSSISRYLDIKRYRNVFVEDHCSHLADSCDLSKIELYPARQCGVTFGEPVCVGPAIDCLLGSVFVDVCG